MIAEVSPLAAAAMLPPPGRPTLRSRKIGSRLPDLGPRCRGVACWPSPRHLGANSLLGQHLEEIVARDVFVEVDAAGVDLDAFARPWRSLSAGVVDLAVDLEQAVVLGACRGGGVDDEDHPAAAEVRRQRNPFAFHGYLA